MALLLTHLSGAHKGQVDRFTSSAERLRFGRAADNDVRLSPADTVVSSRHAEIRSGPRGFVIEDLGSRNGTLVNGQLVERAPLTSGDVIQLGLGGPELLFEDVGDETRARAEEYFAVLAGLLEAAEAVDKFMAGYLGEMGLTATKFNTLQVLGRESSAAVTQNELSSKLEVTTASITGVLDRLERDNLVSRESHPTDRRANLVRLTEEGETLANRAADVHAVRIQALFSCLTPEERRTLSALLARVAEAARKK
jgi:DNA-binding MarR family transcriptional regulator